MEEHERLCDSDIETVLVSIVLFFCCILHEQKLPSTKLRRCNKTNSVGAIREWAVSLAATQWNADNTLSVSPRNETQTLPTYCSADCTALSGTTLPVQCHKRLSSPGCSNCSPVAHFPVFMNRGHHLGRPWSSQIKMGVFRELAHHENMIKRSIEEQAFVLRAGSRRL